jgi:hypothetical protein
VLRTESEADREAAEDGSQPVGTLDESVQRVHGCKEATGCAGVRGDKGRVRQDGRVKDENGERNQAGGRAEHLTGRDKEQQAQRQAEDERGHMHAKKKRVRGVKPAVPGGVAK